MPPIRPALEEPPIRLRHTVDAGGDILQLPALGAGKLNHARVTRAQVLVHRTHAGVLRF